MNNSNVAFVSKVEGSKVEYYFNPNNNTYSVIFEHLSGGPTFMKDEKGDWKDINGTSSKATENIVDSQIKRFEEGKNK